MIGGKRTNNQSPSSPVQKLVPNQRKADTKYFRLDAGFRLFFFCWNLIVVVLPSVNWTSVNSSNLHWSRNKLSLSKIVPLIPRGVISEPVVYSSHIRILYRANVNHIYSSSTVLEPPTLSLDPVQYARFRVRQYVFFVLARVRILLSPPITVTIELVGTSSRARVLESQQCKGYSTCFNHFSYMRYQERHRKCKRTFPRLMKLKFYSVSHKSFASVFLLTNPIAFHLVKDPSLLSDHWSATFVDIHYNLHTFNFVFHLRSELAIISFVLEHIIV